MARKRKTGSFPAAPDYATARPARADYAPEHLIIARYLEDSPAEGKKRDNAKALERYRLWWMTEHDEGESKTWDYSKQLPKDLKTRLRMAIDTVITASARKRIISRLDSMEENPFWKLSWLDAFGLFGKEIFNNREFLEDLPSLQFVALDRAEALVELEKASTDRRNGIFHDWAANTVSKKHEWRPYDHKAASVILQKRRRAEIEIRERNRSMSSVSGENADAGVELSRSEDNQSKQCESREEEEGTQHGKNDASRNGNDEQGNEVENATAEDDDDDEIEPENGRGAQATRRARELEFSFIDSDYPANDGDFDFGYNNSSSPCTSPFLFPVAGTGTLPQPRARLSAAGETSTPTPTPTPRFQTPASRSESPSAPTSIMSKRPADTYTGEDDINGNAATALKKVKRPGHRRTTKSLIHPRDAPVAVSSPAAAVASMRVWVELLDKACNACDVAARTYDDHRRALSADSNTAVSTSSYCALIQPDQGRTEWQLLYLDIDSKQVSTYCPSRHLTGTDSGELLMKSLNFTVRGTVFDKEITKLSVDALDVVTGDANSNVEGPDLPNTHVLVAAVAAFLCSEGVAPEQVSAGFWAGIIDFLESHNGTTSTSVKFGAAPVFNLNSPVQCEAIAREEAMRSHVRSTSDSPTLQALREAWFVAHEVSLCFDDAEQQVSLLCAEAQAARKLLKSAGGVTTTAPASRIAELNAELQRLEQVLSIFESLNNWPPGTSREDYVSHVHTKRQEIANAQNAPAQSPITLAAAHLESKMCSMIADFTERKSDYRKAKDKLEGQMQWFCKEKSRAQA